MPKNDPPRWPYPSQQIRKFWVNGSKFWNSVESTWKYTKFAAVYVQASWVYLNFKAKIRKFWITYRPMLRYRAQNCSKARKWCNLEILWADFRFGVYFPKNGWKTDQNGPKNWIWPLIGHFFGKYTLNQKSAHKISRLHHFLALEQFWALTEHRAMSYSKFPNFPFEVEIQPAGLRRQGWVKGQNQDFFRFGHKSQQI